MTVPSGSIAHPIFSLCPALRDGLAHVPLGQFPTPVERHDALAHELGIRGLWVKRDDLSGAEYGGNKVRKLEFLLADALARQATEIVTFGAVGSNHALATTLYARRLGLATTLFLTPQPCSHHVRQTLLVDRALGAGIHYAEDRDVAAGQARSYVAEREAAGGRPYVIPFGGTNAYTAAALVDAGLELSMQAAQGEAVLPDVVYVAFGSMGTAAGIALGLAAAEAPTEVRAVRVTPEAIASAAAFEKLMAEASGVLCDLDPGCGCADSTAPNARVVEGYFGSGYGEYTEEGMDAVGLAAAEGLRLEGTYTGKTFAALVSAARSGELADKNVLFWNTFNSVDLTHMASGQDYHALPEALHRYFEQMPQPLDRQ